MTLTSSDDISDFASSMLGTETRQLPDIVECMAMTLRLHAGDRVRHSANPSLNAAAILHSAGFTASDIVEHLPDVMARARS